MRARFLARVLIVPVLTCLLLLTTLMGSGTALAKSHSHHHSSHSHDPSLTVQPGTVFTARDMGCAPPTLASGTVNLSGRGFFPSSGVFTNFADVHLSSLYGDAIFKGDGTTTMIPLNTSGAFSVYVTICTKGIPGDVLTLQAQDNLVFTSFSNVVHTTFN